MTDNDIAGVARNWWDAIDKAEFARAASYLEPNAVVDWPLSNERIPSPAAWQEVNEAYPGKWRATILDQVAEGTHVVTITRVYDSSIEVLAISHFTLEGDKIAHLVEYWPETYASPAWRSGWTTPLNLARNSDIDGGAGE